jgi:hypothetical protein
MSDPCPDCKTEREIAAIEAWIASERAENVFDDSLVVSSLSRALDALEGLLSYMVADRERARYSAADGRKPCIATARIHNMAVSLEVAEDRDSKQN